MHSAMNSETSEINFSDITADTSATPTTTTTSSSTRHHVSTITEPISPSVPSSHLDYHHYQSDGEYSPAMPKQYHSGELDNDNDVGDEEFHGNPLDRGPFFEISATKNITAIAGHSAYLNCRVRNLGNRTVSRCPRGETITRYFSQRASESQLAFLFRLRWSSSGFHKYLWDIFFLLFLLVHLLIKPGYVDPPSRFAFIDGRQGDLHAGRALPERA
jgi:hypothetical protein